MTPIQQHFCDTVIKTKKQYQLDCISFFETLKSQHQSILGKTDISSFNRFLKNIS